MNSMLVGVVFYARVTSLSHFSLQAHDIARDRALKAFLYAPD